jgi:coenzyme PQQ precursor peptide PqqA
MSHDHDHETRPDWQTPECEQISVSAEVTAYMGASTDLD